MHKPAVWRAYKHQEGNTKTTPFVGGLWEGLEEFQVVIPPLHALQQLHSGGNAGSLLLQLSGMSTTNCATLLIEISVARADFRLQPQHVVRAKRVGPLSG